jgi:hypothetical protein
MFLLQFVSWIQIRDLVLFPMPRTTITTDIQTLVNEYDYNRQVQVPESGSNSQTVKILKYDYIRQVQGPKSGSHKL